MAEGLSDIVPIKVLFMRCEILRCFLLFALQNCLCSDALVCVSSDETYAPTQ